VVTTRCPSRCGGVGEDEAAVGAGRVAVEVDAERFGCGEVAGLELDAELAAPSSIR
jgi:hypothetical protein